MMKIVQNIRCLGTCTNGKDHHLTANYFITLYRTELTSSSNMYKGSWIHSINIKRLPALEVTVFGLSNAFFLQIFLVRLRYLIVQQI